MKFYAQTGINTKTPNDKTLLHISEQKDGSSNIDKKGVIIPRLTEAERDQIAVTSNENSLMIYNTTENCYNFWNAFEESWKSICGNKGNADFTFTCSNVEVLGQYFVNKELNSNNYLLIKNVDVTKIGAYVVTVNSTVGNGYSFTGSGEFITTGLQSIKLYAQGTPGTSQTDVFEVISSSKTQNVDCNNVQVVVNSQISTFNIDCGTATVNGVFTKGSTIINNTISIKVTAQTTGSYHVYTENINGISFSKTGTFSTTGPQVITLNGSGTLNSPSSFNIEILTNSNITSKCSVNIPVIYTSMTYGIIGSNSTYSWGSPARKAALAKASNFGPNGLVQIESFSMAWQETDANDAISRLIQQNKPDIVLYNAYALNPTVNLIQALNNYVNAGGVLIFGTKDGDFASTNLLLDGIFGPNYTGAAAKQGRGVDDEVYLINSIQNDPIINGPFGNTAGLYWGEDNATTGTIMVPTLPQNSIQISSAFNVIDHDDNDPASSTVWYNNSKNFVYFGDSVGSADNKGTNDYPAYYKNGSPLAKLYGLPSSQRQIIANAILELNAVAWAIHKAATNGINSY